MPKKILKTFLIIGSLVFVVFGASFSFAAVPNEVERRSPTNGALNIPQQDYFKWSHVSGATSYILSLKSCRDRPACPSGMPPSPVCDNNIVCDQNEECLYGFSQEEDDIPTPPGISPGGEIALGFLNISAGRINYSDTYCWKVRGRNSEGEGRNQPNWFIFGTQSPPATTPPPPPPGSRVDLPGPISAQNLDQLFKAVVNFLFILALGIGPIMIIYAGFLILTSGGNVQKVTLARTIILWTLIALAIIFFAKGLTSLVKGALGG